MTAEPQDILYQTEFPCHKLNLTNMARRRLDECFTDHPDVSYRIWNSFGPTVSITKI